MQIARPPWSDGEPMNIKPLSEWTDKDRKAARRRAAKAARFIQSDEELARVRQLSPETLAMRFGIEAERGP